MELDAFMSCQLYQYILSRMTVLLGAELNIAHNQYPEFLLRSRAKMSQKSGFFRVLLDGCSHQDAVQRLKEEVGHLWTDFHLCWN